MTLTIRLADNSQITCRLAPGASVDEALTDAEITAGVPVTDWDFS